MVGDVLAEADLRNVQHARLGRANETTRRRQNAFRARVLLELVVTRALLADARSPVDAVFDVAAADFGVAQLAVFVAGAHVGRAAPLAAALGRTDGGFVAVRLSLHDHRLVHRILNKRFVGPYVANFQQFVIRNYMYTVE